MDDLVLVQAKQRGCFANGEGFRRLLAQSDPPDDESVLADVFTHRVLNELALGLARGGHRLARPAGWIGRQADIRVMLPAVLAERLGIEALIDQRDVFAAPLRARMWSTSPVPELDGAATTCPSTAGVCQRYRTFFQRLLMT